MDIFLSYSDFHLTIHVTVLLVIAVIARLSGK